MEVVPTAVEVVQIFLEVVQIAVAVLVTVFLIVVGKLVDHFLFAAIGAVFLVVAIG